jgi:outer membrane protein TolC
MGVQASWNLMRGTSDWGEERIARGQWREAKVGLLATRARQRLELASERRNLENLVGRLALARRSAERAAEARRIADLRHREGLASIAERIDAGVLETRMLLGRVAVRREFIGSLARLVLLEGRDPSELAGLAP